MSNTASNYYEVHLQDYLYILKKRRFLILLFMIIVFISTAVLTMKEKIMYQSTGTLLIERDNANVVDFKEVMALDASSTEYYQTQYRMLKSRTLIRRLIDEENLTEDLYFQRLMKGRLRKILRDAFPWPETFMTFLAQPRLEDILVKKMIRVEPVRNSRLVKVSMAHPDPRRAAQMTNTLLDMFIKRNLEDRFSITNQASELISEQLVKLKSKVTIAERKLQQYKEDNNLVTIPSLYEQDEFLQDAKLELVKVQAEEAKLAKRYLPAHPKRIHIKSQIDGLKEEIQKEEDRRLKLSRIAVDYAELEREAVSAQKVYASLLTRLEETASEAQTQTSNIMIVDQATVPEKPFRPKPFMNFLIAIAVGIMGGICLAFFVEYLDSTVKIPEDIEKGLGLELFGIIPHAGSPGFLSKEKIFFNKEKHSPAAESIRALRTVLLFKTRENSGCRFILLTSPNPSEGKSTLSANLAAAFAQNNLKVLMIDADLRKPKLHTLVGGEIDRGLTDILDRDAALQDVVQPGLAGGAVDFVAAGPASSHPTELLGSDKMASFMGSLKSVYDVVLIDTPPFLAVADVAVISEYVQTMVVVARYHKTDRRHLRDIGRRFGNMENKLLGIVINQVSVKERDYYYHQYYYYGYGDGRKAK